MHAQWHTLRRRFHRERNFRFGPIAATVYRFGTATSPCFNAEDRTLRLVAGLYELPSSHEGELSSRKHAPTENACAETVSDPTAVHPRPHDSIGSVAVLPRSDGASNPDVSKATLFFDPHQQGMRGSLKLRTLGPRMPTVKSRRSAALNSMCDSVRGGGYNEYPPAGCGRAVTGSVVALSLGVRNRPKRSPAWLRRTGLEGGMPKSPKARRKRSLRQSAADVASKFIFFANMNRGLLPRIGELA